MTPSYYRCALFDKDIPDLSSFKFTQEEIIFDKFTKGNKSVFKKLDVKYEVKFKASKIISDQKVPLIIPVKDLPQLLLHTLGKLKKHKVSDHCNIFIVDDRSGPEIKQICSEHPEVSYIRVDNPKGFNYSNIMNIAVYILNKLGFEQFIAWNSDMWPSDSQTVPELIRRHNASKCTVSGTKLIYPIEAWNGEEVTKNIKYHFPSEKETFRGTVQYGGSILVPYQSTMSTQHIKRFGDPEHPLVNQDYAVLFVTGAYSLIEISWFISSGGFNPSFSKIFNDTDMCLRAIEDGKTVMYFGEGIYLNHDESVNLSNDQAHGSTKIDKQYTSDCILYSKVWPLNRILKLAAK